MPELHQGMATHNEGVTVSEEGGKRRGEGRLRGTLAGTRGMREVREAGDGEPQEHGGAVLPEKVRPAPSEGLGAGLVTSQAGEVPLGVGGVVQCCADVAMKRHRSMEYFGSMEYLEQVLVAFM